MHKLIKKSRFRFFSILGKNLDFRFRIRNRPSLAIWLYGMSLLPQQLRRRLTRYLVS